MLGGLAFGIMTVSLQQVRIPKGEAGQGLNGGRTELWP